MIRKEREWFFRSVSHWFVTTMWITALKPFHEGRLREEGMLP
jgi:hypothetical protein